MRAAPADYAVESARARQSDTLSTPTRAVFEVTCPGNDMPTPAEAPERE